MAAEEQGLGAVREGLRESGLGPRCAGALCRVIYTKGSQWEAGSPTASLLVSAMGEGKSPPYAQSFLEELSWGPGSHSWQRLSGQTYRCPEHHCVLT